jgi:hypothetical protein
MTLTTAVFLRRVRFSFAARHSLRHVCVSVCQRKVIVHRVQSFNLCFPAVACVVSRDEAQQGHCSCMCGVA